MWLYIVLTELVQKDTQQQKFHIWTKVNLNYFKQKMIAEPSETHSFFFVLAPDTTGWKTKKPTCTYTHTFE